MRSVKKHFFPLTVIVLLILMQFSRLTIPITFAQACSATGLVYRDYDQDGTQDALEPAVAGIEVRAYNTAGTQIGSTTTGTNGQYNLGLSDPQARIEFTIPASMAYLRYGRVWDGATATQSTSVNFADCSTGATVFDMGVNNPGQYCQPDPALATTCFTIGPQSGGTDPVLVSFPSSAGSGSFGSYTVPPPPTAFDLPAYTSLANESNIGTTWGLAYHRPSGTIFTSAFMKRHVGLGPGGTGAIYAIRGGSTNTLTTIPGTGADPHPANGAPLDDWLRDVNSWDGVGKIGIGDIDISDDMNTLWAINLANRSLYRIPLNGNPPSAGSVTSFTVPRNQNDCPDPDVDIRPFAVAFNDGLVYVGVVCSAQSTPSTPANLRAYVYTFNPGPNSWAQVFNIALNYPRGCTNQAGLGTCTTNFPAEWHPWVTTFTAQGIFGPTGAAVSYPQPWLTDIEFDNGSLILGIRDRFGDQIGNGAYSTNPADNLNYIGIAAGDILRACSNGAGGWALEGSGACAFNSANGQGPGGGEYYYQDDLANSHDDLFIGGLVQIPGQSDVAGTYVDPIRISGQADVLYDAGIRWLSNVSGVTTRAYRLINGALVLPPTTFGKANGLGDMVALCAPAPIEIGNRVWYDVNDNGIQDPDLATEAPIAGVTVNLYNNSGTLLATTTTAADGSYFFNETNVPGGLQPDVVYNIRLDNAADYTGAGPLTGWGLTTNDRGTDVNDSDGTTVNGFPNIRVRTGDFGENNHTLDFGFTQTPTPTPTRTPGITNTPPPQTPGTPGTPPVGTQIFSKGVNPPFAQPGDIVTWIITVFNPTSVTQTDIRVTDTIPDALEIIDVSATAGNVTSSGQNVTFTLASLAPQQTVTITITTRVRPGAPFIIENVALLRSINWGDVGDGVTAKAQLVLASQQPGTGQTPWWRLPLLVAGIALGLAALRLTLNRRTQT
jgi:uncharacterized repeat protein (TIGR01451 family)